MLLDNLEPHRRDYPCNVAKTLDSLEPEDRAVLEQALADENKWSAYGLHAALKSRGVRLNDKAISKHRLKQCDC